MKVFLLVLVLALLTVAVSAQSADKKNSSVVSVSVADTLSTSSDNGRYAVRDQAPLVYEGEDIEKAEEVNNRSAAVLLATIIGYVIYLLSIK